MRSTVPFPALQWFAIAAALWLAAGPALASGSLRLGVHPTVILADGNSTATVSAQVRDERGRLVADGTEVRFSTTAGTLPQVAFTTGGTARVTLTSSSVPGAAVITAHSGLHSAVATVQMVSDLATGVQGRIIRLSADYVAYSEDLRYLDAAQNVRLEYRDLVIEATALQIGIDSSVLRAHTGVRLERNEEALTGERLVLHLESFDGYLLSLEEGRVYFNAFEMARLEEAPAVVHAGFDFEDLSESQLMWVGNRADYIPGERVQIHRPAAYLAGLRTLGLPHHQVDLQASFGETGHYLGAGTDGLVVDIPFFVQMAPSATTALRVRSGERPGFGYFNRRPGLGLDLEREYGLTGGSGGILSLNQIGHRDWGFHWDHTQLFGDRTRFFAQFDTPDHRDLFGQLNVSHRLSFGSAHLNLTGNKQQERSLGRSLDFSFRTNPKPLWEGGATYSLETRHTDIRAGQLERIGEQTFTVPPQRHHVVGARVGSPSIQLADGLSLRNSLSLRQQWGTSSGFGFGWTSGLNAQLGRSGRLSLNYTYNESPTLRARALQGKQSLGTNLAFHRGKLGVFLFGTLGLDSEMRTLAGQFSYQLTPSWRIDLLPTHFRFGEFGQTDIQFGVARPVLNREIMLYWSTEQRRLLLEFGGRRF